MTEAETGNIVDTMVDGRGVARVPGKTVFVQGAIEGETVRFTRRKKRKNYDEADLVEVLESSPFRVSPECEAFGRCGGCSLQHVDAAEQVNLKQSVLLDSLQRIGSVQPNDVLAPITGRPYGYRRKARLAVKYVIKKGRVLVGFRERNKPFVADMARCETLHPNIGDLLPVLTELITGLSIRERLPQIEAAVGDNAVALIFRVLDPPSSADLDHFHHFQRESGAQVFLQPAGPNSVIPLPEMAAPEDLFYRLPDFGVTIGFSALDFIQVHSEVNAAMVAQAIALLAPDAESRVLDLYCGLGNFTLPIATRAREVVGYEFAAEMVARGQLNARLSGIQNVIFREADLSQTAQVEQLGWRDFDSVMLDPPRTGAMEVLDAVGTLNAERILYVSCHPGTLARDARHIVHELGYTLSAAGVMDMFPHTSHVESMALFQR